MAKITPQVQDDGFVHDRSERIAVGSPAWFAWLEQATTFAFVASEGRFTARKEQGVRGGLYWKAYRTHAGRLRRVYLGKSPDLTLERMQIAAARLSNSSVVAAAEQQPQRWPKAAALTLPQQPMAPAASLHLLTTKLAMPLPRLDLVPRPRLIDQLDGGIGRKLTLISAPAGFGKTTLLSDWIERSERAVASVSLDSADNEPARFWSYVCAALDGLLPGVSESALAALQSPRRLSIESFLIPLINALAALPHNAVLVLDDYHVIDSQPIHDAIALLIDHLPRSLHLVIATRGDPPLPLARWRARGYLCELRAADLRFNPDEATAFLNQTMGLDLTRDATVALADRTEGWIVGLHLAALALQGRRDTDQFIAAFTGSHHYIVDYLADEVLQRQPDDVQNFLLQTSILGRLSGPLCDAVLRDQELGVGQQGLAAITPSSPGYRPLLPGPRSQTMLEALEHANLFLVPLDDERCWYRYHHLFADLLRYRLQQSRRDQVPVLHRRAALWYQHNRLIDEAMGHALAAHDFELAARFVEHNSEIVMKRGEWTRLLRWLEALPDDVVRSRSQLCVAYAWSIGITGNQDAVEPWLQEAERALRANSPESTEAGYDNLAEAATTSWLADVPGHILVLRGTTARVRGDIGRTIELSSQALDHLAADDVVLRGAVLANLGFASWMSGNIKEASEAFAEYRVLSLAAGDIYLALHAMFSEGQLQMLQGRLSEAARIYRQALQLAADRYGRLPVVSTAHLGLAEILRERNELHAALQHLTEGLELAKKLGDVGILGVGYATLARVKQAQGDVEGALDAMEKAVQFVPTPDENPVIAPIAARRAALWVAQANVAAAAQWTREAGLGIDDEVSFRYEAEHIALARVLLYSGQPDEASRLLARLQEAAEAGGRLGHVIEILVLEALVFQAQGKNSLAMHALAKALLVAEPEGYIRIFLDEGASMRVLLLAVQRQQSTVSYRPYIDQLLATFGTSVGDRNWTGRIGTVFPTQNVLSARELDVLRLIAVGRPNAAIAQELVIAVSTVKKHINNLYCKLDVRNRTEAVARARELHLL